MGLLFTHLLSNLGAHRVIGLDRIPSRLEAAKKNARDALYRCG